MDGRVGRLGCKERQRHYESREMGGEESGGEA